MHTCAVGATTIPTCSTWRAAGTIARTDPVAGGKKRVVHCAAYCSGVDAPKAPDDHCAYDNADVLARSATSGAGG